MSNVGKVRAVRVVMNDGWIEALFQTTILPEDPKEAERLLLRMREIIDRALLEVWNGS